MEKSMIPSKKKCMTDGQVDKLIELFRAGLRKHRSEFDSEASQKALGFDGLIPGLLTDYRKRVELFSSMITRIVSVNRAQTPQEALDATGRTQYADNGVVETMPKGEGEKNEVFFFKPDPSAYDKNGRISDDNLEKEFDKRGFKPADPYSIAKANEDDPSFADNHSNGTHWKGPDGKWCHITFHCRGSGERNVSIRREDFGWRDFDWFGGLRK